MSTATRLLQSIYPWLPLGFLWEVFLAQTLILWTGRRRPTDARSIGMPQPRKHKTNADRQAAYRQRVKARQEGITRGQTEIVQRVMAADAKAPK